MIALQVQAAIPWVAQGQANSRTVDSLTGAALHYQDRHGSFPPDLDTLLTFGGEVTPGSLVDFAGPVGGRFCVRVGTDDRREPSGPPHYSGLAFPRHRHHHLVVSTWAGDSCESGS